MAVSSEARFDRCVFVNCPFDSAYKPLLHAILFAIHDCGFIARSALEATGSAEPRLDKIVRIIRESRWSVHDISRVEVDPDNPLPRFNMPFECGLALGAQRFGTARDRRRDFLILTGARHQDKLTLSDLAGQDAVHHGNVPERAIDAMRAFLAPKSRSQVRGGAAIKARYTRFRAELPRLAAALEIGDQEILSFEYLPDWLRVMNAWLVQGGAPPS
jgi:hypothetical protein